MNLLDGCTFNMINFDECSYNSCQNCVFENTHSMNELPKKTMIESPNTTLITGGNYTMNSFRSYTDSIHINGNVVDEYNDSTIQMIISSSFIKPGTKMHIPITNNEIICDNIISYFEVKVYGKCFISIGLIDESINTFYENVCYRLLHFINSQIESCWMEKGIYWISF